MAENIQELCSRGQDLLIATEYLQAERCIAQAEKIAIENRDWDSLSRLYMPLQECRRQIRQLCGEGIVKLDYIARSDSESFSADEVLQKQTQGQILVADFGSINTAIELRRHATERQLYLDVFLAASYWVNGTVAVAIVPHETTKVPEEGEYSIDQLMRQLPPHSLLIPASELPTGEKRGNAATFAMTMNLWEKLHLPFLAMADHTKDLERRIHAYRDTIAVDYACELAHQKLSDTARKLAAGH